MKIPNNKKYATHLLSFLTLLVLGIFVVSSMTTPQAKADGLTIDAAVDAPLVANPATIQSHYNEQHVQEAEVTIAGTCSPWSYVQLFQNGRLVGVSACTTMAYSVQSILDVGRNELVARIYNLTNNEGPVMTPIVVYYDASSAVSEASTPIPTSFRVASLDGSAYDVSKIYTTSTRPTVTGFAPPFARVTITFHSKVQQCLTSANSVGWWSCTPSVPLEPGLHTVDVVGNLDDGRTVKLTAMRIFVVEDRTSLLIPPRIVTPLITLATEYTYSAKTTGNKWLWNIKLSGGLKPYKVSIEWGDGKREVYSDITDDSLDISHVFATSGVFKPYIQVEDAGKALTSIQLLAVVRDAPVAVSVLCESIQRTVATSQDSALGHACVRKNPLDDYAWILQPIYGVVLVVILFFWLGEYRVLERIRARRR
jgi:hypothetical protein